MNAGFEAQSLFNLGLLSNQQKKSINTNFMNHSNEVYKLNQISEIQVTYKPIYKFDQRTKITTSHDADTLLRKVWNWDTINFNEEFVAIYLNRANQVLGVYKHSSGTESACLVSVKQLLAVGLKSNASSFIIAHNHPSSNLKPSNQDIELTKKIKAASDVCELKLLDHLIIRSEDGYYSFADEGLL